MAETLSGLPNLSKLLFSKPAGTETTKTADAPQVPVERLVSSPRRTVGRGRRDTVLTGEDGLT